MFIFYFYVLETRLFKKSCKFVIISLHNTEANVWEFLRKNAVWRTWLHNGKG